jgi:UDP-N-acetylglucosamine 2-epimerase (hydrolysing)
LKKIRKIVFLTGTRADYGKLMPLMDAVETSSQFECFIFITGMHTLSKYGKTFTEVQKHGFKNTFVFMNQTHTTDSDIILANTIMGFSNFVKEISPDLIITHGDRIETLGGAIVGSLNNILVAHIEGGETSGTIDESIRHAVTKLSHNPFCCQ